MKNIFNLFIIILLSLSCAESPAQENPFMKMAGKKYTEYSWDLNGELDKFHKLRDTTEIRKVIRQVEEVYEKTGDITWKLYVTYLEYKLLGLKRELYGEALLPYKEKPIHWIELLKEAEKEQVIPLTFLARQHSIEWYWRLKQYELAFELYAVQANQLENFSLDEIPEKLRYLRHIADAHYYFKDYPKAISFYEKILENKEHSISPNAKQHARNGLALCYRYGYNNLDRSDSCFRLILQPEVLNGIDDEAFHNVWTGIAEGSLGHNLFLRGEYESAIPLLKSSMERMIKDGDYGFAVEDATDLAKIYIEKDNRSEAKYYTFWAKDHHPEWRAGTLPRIYETLSKYYALTGNRKLSMAYMDSTLAENKKEEELFSALQMLRVEQKQNISEQKLKEEQLHVEKTKKERYKRSLIISIFAVLLIGGGLARYFVLFKKKKEAYHELVRKSQEWAQVDKGVTSYELQVTGDELQVTSDELQHEAPDEADLLIMKEIEQAMQEDKLYIDSELTLDSLARTLGAKRNTISAVINRCTQKSFSTFVNEYRIKEAVRLLSQNNAGTFTIDTIAFNVGFTDRHNFYRVFKKMTGLSPTEFRRNAGND